MSAQGMLETFRALDLDHFAVGLGQSPGASPYFCTPVGAEIVGWTGVDGIHFCRVPAVDPELVFVVTPMPCGEHHVEPVARGIRTFFRLLLACGGSNLLEGVSYVSGERFQAWLDEERSAMDGERRDALDKLRKALELEPCPEPYPYIKALQNGFDYTMIPFSEEYYEVTGQERPGGDAVEGGEDTPWTVAVRL